VAPSPRRALAPPAAAEAVVAVVAAADGGSNDRDPYQSPNRNGSSGNTSQGAGIPNAAAKAQASAKKAADAAALRQKLAAKKAAAEAARKLRFSDRASDQLRTVEPGSSKLVARANLKNPKRSDLRKKARIAGSTQYVVPVAGVK